MKELLGVRPLDPLSKSVRKFALSVLLTLNIGSVTGVFTRQDKD